MLDIDRLIYAAAMAGRIWSSDLTPCERIWLVGKLRENGHTIEMVCQRIRVSRRTVQRLNAAYKQRPDIQAVEPIR